MMPLDTQNGPPRVSVPDPGAIDRAVALGWRLITAVEAFASQFAELGDIELPPVVGSAQDQANLRTVAPLYLAAELESARLVPAAEALAELFVHGALRGDLGPAATRYRDDFDVRTGARLQRARLKQREVAIGIAKERPPVAEQGPVEVGVDGAKGRHEGGRYGSRDGPAPRLEPRRPDA